MAVCPRLQIRGLPFSEIFLEYWIEFYVVGIVEKEVELNVHIPWAREQGSVERVSLGRDDLGIGNAGGIFPAHAFQV